MGLVGSARDASGNGNEHLTSLIASETSLALGTVQAEPIRLTGRTEPLSFQGRVIQSVDPSTLADVFAPPDNERDLALADLRSSALDELFQLAKEQGTPRQIEVIDRLAISREQAKGLDEALIERFSMIDGNDARNQLRAALTLFLMNLTPVATVKMSFGSDNHADPGLVRERNETVEAFRTLADFYTELAASPLADRVTVANLGVFGRTMNNGDTEGRDHNLNHHAMMISGANVEGGVFGTLTRTNRDFGATSIDSVTGAGGEGGDIPEEETLEAAAKTLATVVGVPDDTIQRRIVGGRVIRPALKG